MIKSDLQKFYENELIPQWLKNKLYKNSLQTVRILKIILNIGLGEGVNDKNIVKRFIDQLSLISGQQAIPTLARDSIANFKLREGMEIGCKVTLTRKKLIFIFLEKLIKVALPQLLDFRGISPLSFDRFGNLTFALKEQTCFPEIEDIYRLKGMMITIVTNTKSREKAIHLLESLGMPFQALKTKLKKK